MPRLSALLILTSCLVAHSAAEDTLRATAFDRYHAGAASSGPRGLPAPGHRTLKPRPSLGPTTFLRAPGAEPPAAPPSAPPESETTPAVTNPASPVASGEILLASAEEPVTKEPTDEAADAPGVETDSVEPAVEHPEAATSQSQGLKLGASSEQSSGKLRYGDNPLRQALEWRPPTDSMTTIGSGMAIVLGLLLVTSWVIKKSLPRSARVLPGEVAEVLGRVTLGRKQTAQLLKIGRKLVLVSTTPDGAAETITEIDSEHDVQHLLRLCEEHNGRGSSAAFDDIFRELTGERAASGFLGDEAPAYDPRRLAAAYANTPGGQGRG